MLSISGHLELEASLLAAHLAEVEDVRNSLGKKADRLEAELVHRIASHKRMLAAAGAKANAITMKLDLESQDWFRDGTIEIKDLERDMKFLEQYVTLGMAKSRLLDGLIRRGGQLDNLPQMSVGHSERRRDEYENNKQRIETIREIRKR